MTTAMPLASPRTVLSALPKQRLAELGREPGLDAPESWTRDAQVDALLPAMPPLPDVVGRLGRDELRAVCRALSLDDRARGRSELAARILGTTPEAPRASTTTRCLAAAREAEAKTRGRRKNKGGEGQGDQAIA